MTMMMMMMMMIIVNKSYGTCWHVWVPGTVVIEQVQSVFWYDIVEFNVPLGTSFRRRFYGSHDPNNSVIALKDNG